MRDLRPAGVSQISADVRSFGLRNLASLWNEHERAAVTALALFVSVSTRKPPADRAQTTKRGAVVLEALIQS